MGSLIPGKFIGVGGILTAGNGLGEQLVPLIFQDGHGATSKWIGEPNELHNKQTITVGNYISVFNGRFKLTIGRHGSDRDGRSCYRVQATSAALLAVAGGSPRPAAVAHRAGRGALR